MNRSAIPAHRQNGCSTDRDFFAQRIREELLAISRSAPRGVRTSRTLRLEGDVEGRKNKVAETLAELLTTALANGVDRNRVRGFVRVIEGLVTGATAAGTLGDFPDLSQHETDCESTVNPLQHLVASGRGSEADKRALLASVTDQMEALGAMRTALEITLYGREAA